MNKSKTFILIAILCLTVAILSACSTNSAVVIQQEEDYVPLKVVAPDCFYGGQIKSIEALNRDTVQFTLCNPDAAFLAKLASPSFSIIDSESLDAAKGDSTILSTSVNGTGPYIVSRQVPGSELELSVNPNYWGVPARLEKITFIYSADANTRLLNFRGGRGQGMDALSSKDYDNLRTNENYNIIFRPSLSFYYLGMNHSLTPFNNQSIRQAFAQVLDRDVLLKTYFSRGSTRADQVLPSNLKPGYTEGLLWYDIRPLDAQSLLTANGYDFNQVIPLYYSSEQNNELLDPDGLASAIRDAFAAIQVNIVPTPVASDELKRMIDNGEAIFYLANLKGTYIDAASLVSPLFIENPNWLGGAFLNLQVDALGGNRAIDNLSRQERYDTFNHGVYDSAPIIPLAHAVSTVIFNANIENVAVNALFENYEEMTRPDRILTFIQSREPQSLWPGDEADPDTLRVNRLVYDTLVKYDNTGSSILPSLAESWEANDVLTVYTFNLRYAVKYSNGATLDANDVVASFAALWDASNPNHKGRTGEFAVFKNCFGGFLNAGQ